MLPAHTTAAEVCTECNREFRVNEFRLMMGTSVMHAACYIKKLGKIGERQ